MPFRLDPPGDRLVHLDAAAPRQATGAAPPPRHRRCSFTGEATDPRRVQLLLHTAATTTRSPPVLHHAVATVPPLSRLHLLCSTVVLLRHYISASCHVHDKWGTEEGGIGSRIFLRWRR
ncbi:hypothetical protein E2562_032855 [Oryza meyeriana var. granulata]|uniref:Uncharacterized protein n=1 Tax=Oryza meyeriana var. granulata TaxID=110450 RepID=A0A6G1BPV1_9ORYZ|nr:hypothetical protein E2562_032855 [Oryza meyeriana var. granulata]